MDRPFIRIKATLQKLLPILGMGLLLSACGVAEGQFRIRGTYDSFKQGADFLIVSPDGGLNRLDTLHILAGDFEYTCDLSEDATYYIVYPDNSTLTIWGHSGDDIRIKESGEGLWNVKVEGNAENELYTQFRLQNAPNDTTKLRQSAARLIRQNPTSAVSQYLLSQFFILAKDVDADSINTLYQVIQDALPQDPEVATLGGQIQQRFTLRKGNKMPDFDIITGDSVHHTLGKYKGKNLVLYFWAGWQGSVAYLHKTLADMKKELAHPADGTKATEVELLGYSLDVDSVTLRINKSEDAKDIPTYCDLQGFSSPLASQLGVRTLPLIVAIDKNGKILTVCKEAKDVRKALTAK